jgi:hypothetical protein
MARKRTERGYICYSPALAQELCDEMASGKSLTEVCTLPGMPDRHSVRRWVVQNPEFRAQYEAARLWWAHAVAEDLNDLADRVPRLAEEAEASGRNGNAAVSALRTTLENKRWLLSKILPQQYGDRQTTELVGAGGKDLMPATEMERTNLALLILTILRQPSKLSAPAEPPSGIRFIDTPASTGTLLSASPKPEPEPVEPVEPALRPKFDTNGFLIEPSPPEPEPTLAELAERERYLSAVRAEPSPPAPARRRYPRVH